MEDLYIVEKFKEQDSKKNEKFLNNIISKGNLAYNRELDIIDDEGIVLIEETMPYIENIYRNPNSIIINAEEIVKVELAKKITSYSVKHLSKNTRLIRNINEEGDVEPSKILNISKEESYDTYENRLIFFLIKNINIYLSQKKEYLEQRLLITKLLKEKKLDYVSNIELEEKNISLNLKVDTMLNSNGVKNLINKNIEKINGIEKRLKSIMRYPIYKTYENKRVKPIMSPIKRTNLIKKNTNFQYAVKLWDYLQEKTQVEAKRKKKIVNIDKETQLKSMLNEISLLYYIAIESYDSEQKEKKITEAKKKFLSKTLKWLDLPNKEIEKVIVKNKKKNVKDVEVNKEIKNIFNKYIHKYLNKIQ